jgi:hypothetical protein
MGLSAELARKSVDAAISAIEMYNKPNFSYREEAFVIFMTNAWELLVKAKWLPCGTAACERSMRAQAAIQRPQPEPDLFCHRVIDHTSVNVDRRLAQTAAEVTADRRIAEQERLRWPASTSQSSG